MTTSADQGSHKFTVVVNAPGTVTFSAVDLDDNSLFADPFDVVVS